MFADRKEAGRALAVRLKGLDPETTVILALPRGGVPVAREVADALGAPLDLMLVRKIGAPWQPELAIGAIADGPIESMVLNDELVRSVGLREVEILRLVGLERAELERRRAAYLDDRPPVSLDGKTAVLVDDGIATGATMRAAARAARARGAARTIIAVPLASRESVRDLAAEADEVIALETPDPFWAVGAHYKSFPQVGDDEVIWALGGRA
jgi:putative phosphoribosyl transferase